MKQNTLLQLSLISLLATLTQPAFAKFTDGKCDHVLVGSGDIQINRQWDPATRTCFIALNPRNVDNLKYRDYYFSNQGEMMVFNSYGDGPDSTMTASRDFFIMPVVNEYPDYSIEDNGDVTVKLVSGHLFRVSAKDFSIVSLTPGTFTEKALSPNNQGGVEIMLLSGFWIDGGFRKGGTRFSNPNFKSGIHSAKSSALCGAGNSTFLDYDSNGNYTFKFQGTAFNSYIAKQCPQFPAAP